MNNNKARRLRMTTMSVAALAIIIGVVSHTGLGSLCSFGIGDISVVCPLGYLETALASHRLLPYVLISFLVIAGLTVLLGRFFCGWICPVPLGRKLLTNKLNEDVESCTDCTSEKGKNSTSGLVILGVTLGSSAICGFPVFCLICPIGLIFATAVALIRLINLNEPTLDIILFPALVIIEIVLLRKWCRKICPLGALFSLVSRFNRTLAPKVDKSLCLEETNGTPCQRCRSACSFDIELKNGLGTGDISECTKCRECADNCPVHAIRFHWRR